MSSLNHETQTIERQDVAAQSGLETIGVSRELVSQAELPHLDRDFSEIPVALVEGQGHTFRVGNAIGASEKLKKIANVDLANRPDDEDRLNNKMYSSILQILNGNPGGVKHVRNAPKGTNIFYDGLGNGARVYFAEIAADQDGHRTFIQVGKCGSKGSEPKVLGTLTGNGKKEKVK